MGSTLFFIQKYLTISVIFNAIADDFIFCHFFNQLECAVISDPEVALDQTHTGQLMLQNKTECLFVEGGVARGFLVL